MTLHTVSNWRLAAALVALGAAGIGLNQVRSQQPGPIDADPGVQVLTRGPVHEAFAETITFDPQPGMTVPKAPPQPIEEIPPDQKPDGNHVSWIPGYWGWDDERSDFLWVSGIWRDLPPGRQWVPGYWSESGQGFQWTSGYWVDANLGEVEYLPEPPASLEVGANIAAPSPDQGWIPGCWLWQQNRYAWRPGYWAVVQPDWVWVPAYYAWSPRGYVFVDGYWDYSIARRGMLFAPVYFDAGVYNRPGFNYSPAIVINPAVFASQLFLRPNYQHYYFGDYYAANYSTAGFYPSFSYNSNRYGYDPIYAQQRWQHREDRAWDQNVRADFQHRRDHEEARPPRTWAAQTARVASQSQPNPAQKDVVVAASLDQLAKSNGNPLRLQAVNMEERQSLAKHGQEIQSFRQERQKLEAKSPVTAVAGSSQQPEPARVKLPKSPIVARPIDQFSKDRHPPKTHEAPPPDFKFEAKPRVARPSEQPSVHSTNRPPINTSLPQEGVQPQPKINAPPQPQPRLNSPHEVQPKFNPPAQPQPKVNAPQQPQPRLNPPPQPQPKFNPPPQPQPKINAPQQPQPRLNPPPQPQPKFNPPAQPQPKINAPQQPQPRLNPPPQPQPKFNPPPQPQPKINPPPQPQPRGNQPAAPRGPASPQPNKPKEKGK